MENLHDVFSFQTSNSKSVERDKIDEDIEVLATEPKSKRQKRSKGKDFKIEEDENKRNWLDSEVEALIALKGEMQSDFTKNVKKQGINMWLKLHTRLLCLLPNFKKSLKAYKSKFNDLLKTYKEDKQANNISGESRHTCKLYDSMDTWYHPNGSVVKYISPSSSDLVSAKDDAKELKVDNSEPIPNSSLKQRKVLGKQKYQEQALELIRQLVVNNKDMAQSMKVANGFMGSLDKHIERFIDKL